MYGCCVHCKKFTRVNRLQSCNSCHIIDEQALQHAKAILRTDGTTTVFELAKQVSVPPERIFLWLQQGRLKSFFFKHLCPICGGDLLNDGCKCNQPDFGIKPQEENPVLFPKKRHIIKLERFYWDEVSRIRRKQHLEHWFPTEAS